MSCAVLCQIVSLQYLSRSSLHRLAGLPCCLFLSYGLQVVTREVHRSSLAFAKHRYIFKSLAICLKRQVCNSCVLPAMTYGAETWTLTKEAQDKLVAAQTKMERSMLNITYKDRNMNIWVRERTKVIDITNHLRRSQPTLQCQGNLKYFSEECHQFRSLRSVQLPRLVVCDFIILSAHC